MEVTLDVLWVAAKTAKAREGLGFIVLRAISIIGDATLLGLRKMTRRPDTNIACLLPRLSKRARQYDAEPEPKSTPYLDIL